MKRFSRVCAWWWLVIGVMLAGILPGGAQNWIQWSLKAGGNNHYYALTPSPTNWTAAQELAVSWGGTLATITSAEEQNFINTAFLNGEFEHRPVWIGLFEETGKGVISKTFGSVHIEIGHPKTASLHWVTGEPLSYGNWKPGEPSHFPDEHYVAINWEYSDSPPRGTKGDWNDTPLNGTTHYGGNTTGPYFGLVERETDPSLPPIWRLAKSAVWIGPIAVLVVIIIIFLVRRKRQKREVV